VAVAEQNRVVLPVPPQQGCPTPPQVSQEPLAEQLVPVVPQEAPGLAQTKVVELVRTQHPLAHWLFAQQGPPGSPHFWQIEVLKEGVPEQDVSASLQKGVVRQQLCPTFPHSQLPARQMA
jgi:hypothetical protein